MDKSEEHLANNQQQPFKRFQMLENMDGFQCILTAK